MRTRAALTVITLVVCLLSSLPVLAQGGHDRDGTVVGINLGAGWAKVKYDLPDDAGDGTFSGETNTKSAFTGGFRVGWAPNDNFIYSVGMYGWKRSFNQQILPMSVRTFNFLVELSWFPTGEGFWLRGGVGGGHLDFSATLPEARTTFQESGWNVAGGAGWELRISDEAAFGIAYDYRYLSVGAFEGLENTISTTHNLTLNIHWYM